MKKNTSVCDYCRLLQGVYQRSDSAGKRRALIRFKLHRRKLHKNPEDPNRVRIAKAAWRITYALYKRFKNTGVPEFVINRIPADIRPYVIYGLKLNEIKVIKK